MINFFKGNQSIVLVLIPMIVGLHLILSYYNPWIEVQQLEQYNLLGIDFYQLHPVFSKLLAWLMISANAIMVNFIFNRLEFYDRNTFLPSILYVVVLAVFPESLLLGEMLIGHFFFIIAIYQLLSIQQGEDARSFAFIGTFFLGGATLFVPLYITGALLFTFVLFNVRPFVWREHALVYAGLLPALIWVPVVNQQWPTSFFNNPQAYSLHQYNTNLLLVIIAALCMLFLIAVRGVLIRRSKSSIRFKKISQVVIVILVFLLVVGNLLPVFELNDAAFTPAVIVSALLLPYAFLDRKHTWIANFFFYLLIIVNIIKFFYSGD